MAQPSRIRRRPARYLKTATTARKTSYVDSISPLIPMDMALVWGKLVDPEFRDFVTYGFPPGGA